MGKSLPSKAGDKKFQIKYSAEAWTPIFMTLKEGQAFGRLMDFSSVRQEHYTLVKL